MRSFILRRRGFSWERTLLSPRYFELFLERNYPSREPGVKESYQVYKPVGTPLLLFTGEGHFPLGAITLLSDSGRCRVEQKGEEFLVHVNSRELETHRLRVIFTDLTQEREPEFQVHSEHSSNPLYEGQPGELGFSRNTLIDFKAGELYTLTVTLNSFLSEAHWGLAEFFCLGMGETGRLPPSSPVKSSFQTRFRVLASEPQEEKTLSLQELLEGGILLIETRRLARFKSNLKVFESPECVICLEEGVDTVLVPCGHKCGHRSCVTGLGNCPVCRAEVMGFTEA